MRPLGNRVLVKRIIPEAKKGAVLLVTSEEKVKTGLVIAIGLRCVVEETNKVIFPMYAGTPVTVNDTNDEYLIISEDEILAVLED